MNLVMSRTKQDPSTTDGPPHTSYTAMLSAKLGFSSQPKLQFTSTPLYILVILAAVKQTVGFQISLQGIANFLSL